MTHQTTEPSSERANGVTKVEPGFRWDGDKLHHVPMLTLEFEPVPMNSPNDAKGWADRDALAAALLSSDAKPVREWVGLTDEEMAAAWFVADNMHNASAVAKRRITRAIEAKLREKNATLSSDAPAGGEAVAKFFLPPARHEGSAEHAAGTYHLRVTGLTIRQIKEIFEDKFLGSMVWSNGAAYPTDGVEIRFAHPQPARTAEPLTDDKIDDLSREMVKGGKSVNWLTRAMLEDAPKPKNKEPGA